MKSLVKKLSLKSLANLGRDQRGLSTVEYIIILVLIAAGGISLWTNFGDTVKQKITDSTAAVESVNVD